MRPRNKFGVTGLRQINVDTTLGFLFSLKARTIPEAPVEVLKSGENLNLKWNSLSVNALIKPYEERATLVLK